MKIERAEAAPLSEKLFRELDDAQRAALARQELIEPTEGERKNGWTADTLTTYLTERLAGQSLAADAGSVHRRAARRPNVQNHHYRPHRWRR